MSPAPTRLTRRRRPLALVLLPAAALAAGCGPAASGPPRSGAGAEPAGADTTDTYLHLVLQVDRSGAAELVSAAEVPGRPVLSGYPVGDYWAAISRDGETIAVESLADPFTAHGFGGDPAEHHDEGVERATIAVKVPGGRLDDPDLEALAVTLYRLPPNTPVAEVDAETLAALVKDGDVETVATLGGSELAAAVRALAAADE